MAASGLIRAFESALRAKAYHVKGVKNLAATASLTRANHAGRTCVVTLATGITLTLPAGASTVLGDKYRVVFGVTLTGNTVIQVANASDVMAGGILINDIGDTSAATADFFPTAASSDTVTVAYATGAGKLGDCVEFEYVATNKWIVRGQFQGMTDPASPFSAAV